MINSKNLLFVLCAVLSMSLGNIVQAQVIRCSTVDAEKERRVQYKFLSSEKEFEKWMASKLNDRRNKLVPFGTGEVSDPDLIPVVVHVIYREGELYGEGVNITDEQIYSQIEVLNEDYQRQNWDTVNTQLEFQNVASNLNIEFVLARQTETGDPTTGINRVEGPKSSYEISLEDRELLSSLSHWDPNLYLNIWVTNLRSPYIGLAQFPDYNLPGLEDEENKDNEATDGMVIDYQAFGSSAKVPGLDLISEYNLGRTATHEIGHFFGLKHVWGDGGCSVDDYVSDTPNSDNEYSGICNPSDHVSCGTNDMFENFLYYTNDECMNIFTVGQVSRMEIILDDAPRRASLLNSIGTSYPEDMYFDLAIQSIKSPGKVECGMEIQSAIEIKNNGTIPVKNFNIDYSLNDFMQTYSYDGDTIFTGEVVDVLLPETQIENGNYQLLVELKDIPDDVNGTNDRMDLAFAVDDQTDFIPLREQFEVASINETNWIIINDDDDISWKLANAPSVSSENNAAFNNLYNYEQKNELDWLISPALDFSDAIEASLTFKTSYAKNQDFNDQLRILISTDCGSNFDQLIEIFNSSDLSIEPSTEFWEPDDQNDWMNHSIDLNTYAGMENIRLAFLSVNGFGNNLYLDDIEFFNTDIDDLVQTAQGSFVVYPNPSSDGQIKVTFNTSERQNVYVSIYDNMGKLVTRNEYQNTLNQTYYYDLTGYRSGIYYIHSIGEDFVRTKRLVIN